MFDNKGEEQNVELGGVDEEQQQQQGISGNSGDIAHDDSTAVEQQPHVLLLSPQQREQQEQAVLSKSQQLWKDIKTTFRKFRYPGCVVVINIISWIVVQVLIAAGGEPLLMNGQGYRGDPYENLQFKTMIKTGLLISLLTFLYDAYISFNGATTFDNKWKDEQQHHDGNGATTNPSTATNTAGTTGITNPNNGDDNACYDYLKLSKRVDTMFGCGTSGGGTATFIVCFLYSVWAVSLWQASAAATGLLEIQFVSPNDIPTKGMCFMNDFFSDGYYDDDFDEQEQRNKDARKDVPNFNTLPGTVQEWLQQLQIRGNVFSARDRPPNSKFDFNQSLPYLEVVDGTFVFAKAIGDRYRRRHYGTNIMDNKPGIAVYNPRNTTSIIEEHNPMSYSKIKRGGLWNALMDYPQDNEEEVELIGFPAKGPPYVGWCGIFKAYGNNILEDEVICYNAKSQHMTRFDLVRDTGREWNGWSNSDYAFLGLGDSELWMYTNRKVYRQDGKKNVHILTVMSFNMETMEKHVALKTETERKNNFMRRSGTSINPSCTAHVWMTTLVSLIVLSILSAYLYRADIPSCTAPLSLSLSLVISSFLHPAAAGAVLLLMALLCLYLLVGVGRSSKIWKFTSTTMLIWALYVLQLSASWVFWSPSFLDYDFFENEIYFTFLPFPLLSFVVAATTNVVLNHPFLQVLALGFGSLSIVSVIMVLMGLNFLLVPLFLLALSLGCFRAGSLLQLYRVHIIVHSRRFFTMAWNWIRRMLPQRVR